MISQNIDVQTVESILRHRYIYPRFHHTDHNEYDSIVFNRLVKKPGYTLLTMKSILLSAGSLKQKSAFDSNLSHREAKKKGRKEEREESCGSLPTAKQTKQIIQT